jgi:hypothetical protein
MSSTKDITENARFLRNANPQAYEKFIAVFMKYARDQADVLVQTTENLQLAQGHAQQCVKLLRALEEAKNG